MPGDWLFSWNSNSINLLPDLLQWMYILSSPPPFPLKMYTILKSQMYKQIMAHKFLFGLVMTQNYYLLDCTHRTVKFSGGNRLKPHHIYWNVKVAIIDFFKKAGFKAACIVWHYFVKEIHIFINIYFTQ